MKVIKNKVLKDLTSFKIGGECNYFVEINKTEEVFKFYEWYQKNKMPIFVLGGGTNLLINKFNGVVLKPNLNFIQKIEEGVLRVGAGVLVKDLLEYVIELGYQGLEWAGGLPGTVGGAIVGGVGAFGGEFKNLVLSLLALNLKTGEYKFFKKEDCQFGYHTSYFRQNPDWLIIFVDLIFEPGGDKEKLKNIVQKKIEYRKEKHPMEYPSAGSVFKNYPFEKAPKFLQDFVLERNKIKNDPFPLIPIAFLISELGLKGKKIGFAQISEKHSNFIVNLGNATFEDVFNLINFTKKSLEDKFQIEPEIEIRIVDF